jgi:uncharacterized protein (TIGR02246 family)
MLEAKGSIDMTDNHQRIRALFESGCAAWNRGDIDGYLADYWHSDKVRWVSEGTVRYGFEVIAAAYKARFDSPDNMGRLEVANLEIQLLGESDALVFGAWIQTTSSARRHGVFTVQLKKIDGEWLIVSDHSSTGS